MRKLRVFKPTEGRIDLFITRPDNIDKRFKELLDGEHKSPMLDYYIAAAYLNDLSDEEITQKYYDVLVVVFEKLLKNNVHDTFGSESILPFERAVKILRAKKLPDIYTLMAHPDYYGYCMFMFMAHDVDLRVILSDEIKSNGYKDLLFLAELQMRCQEIRTNKFDPIEYMKAFNDLPTDVSDEYLEQITKIVGPYRVRNVNYPKVKRLTDFIKNNTLRKRVEKLTYYL